ncbi:type II toxin-antitoxin system VapC family toxin [Desulfonatronospira sp.]|uniref:type II toxin-antitoxin system tRNA(fMet)-specific endonuclease VapC n=1 Tax=Desulfonatronospira sp. TaxID=1962951 RepID=UPI0025B8D53E|nr:type II toxin-antitoxin system VapC family toxin [Desulfonatronospira sp.]
MIYLIDTNICIYLMNQKPSQVIQKFKNTEVGQIGISTITVSELNYGVAKSNCKKQNAQRLEEFLTPFEILSYDEAASRYYGMIRADLESQGKVIGPLDMLISAHALSKDLVLVTNNEKEFLRIKSLKVEKWAE